MFFVQHQGFWFPNKQPKKKKQIFGQKGGLQQNGFFINMCFGKCEKLSFFLCPFFGQILGDVQKTL